MWEGWFRNAMMRDIQYILMGPDAVARAYGGWELENWRCALRKFALPIPEIPLETAKWVRQSYRQGAGEW